MLELFVSGAASAVREALTAAAVTGPVAVVGAPKIARLLRDAGLNTVAVGDRSRPLRKLSGAAARARADALPLATGAAGAAVLAEPVEDTTLRESTRIVRPDGLVALVSRADTVELTTRALCGGLMEIEQRQAGRIAVISGRVLGPV